METSWLSPEGALWDGMELEGSPPPCAPRLKKARHSTSAWQSPGPSSCGHPQGKGREKDRGIGHWGSPGNHAGDTEEKNQEDQTGLVT